MIIDHDSHMYNHSVSSGPRVAAYRPGARFGAIMDLVVCQQHPESRNQIPYLMMSAYGIRPDILCGTEATYVGQVEIEEAYSWFPPLNDQDYARVPRHCFEIAGQRYLLTNMDLLWPVTSTD